MDKVKFLPSRGSVNVEGDLGLPKLNQGKRGRRVGSGSNDRTSNDGSSLEIKQRVATLIGMGISQRSIAKQLGISTRRVNYIVSDDIKPNRDGLRDLQLATQAKHHEIVEPILRKAYRAMDKGLDAYNEKAGTVNWEEAPRLGEVAAAARMMAECVTYPNLKGEQPTEIKRTSLNIDLKDPAALKELFAVMRGEDPKQTIDVTPEKECITE